MKRRTFILSAPLAITACGPVLREEVLAPQSAIDRVAVTSPGPRRLSLLTMKNVRSGSGAHTAMIIKASQTVLWDPAGTFGHETIPERNDVHFGITQQLEDIFISFHARETYYVVVQEVDVSPEVAEMALRLVMDNGPTPKAACARHTSRIIHKLPGFETVGNTFFPNSLEKQFAEIPGVRTRVVREDDDDDKSVAAAEIDVILSADQ